MFKADQLRAEGYFVLGGHDLADKLEHDRKFAADITKKAGVDVPETYEFKDISKGLDLLDKNPDKAYIFKPDEPDNESWVTTVPDNERDDKANLEMRLFLESQSDGNSNYILQERKNGVELNVECMLFDGKPYFAYANFECKKNANKDLGALVGCAHDIHFTIPLESKILHETIYKVIALPEFRDYTGFVDMNVIAGDRRYWFLEYCCRFGYNSHPNMFINLAISPLGKIFSDMLTGEDLENFYGHFREGFGASITLRRECPVSGLPIMIDESIEHKFYHFDTYLENDVWKLAGYAKETGIICGFDYDLKSAAEDCLKNLEKIHYPGRYARTDLDETKYFSNPYERWEASETMHLFDRMDVVK